MSYLMNEDGMFRMANQQIKERLAEKQVELAPIRREAELLRAVRREESSILRFVRRALTAPAHKLLAVHRRSDPALAAVAPRRLIHRLGGGLSQVRPQRRTVTRALVVPTDLPQDIADGILV
jgi:hypothetical protein